MFAYTRALARTWDGGERIVCTQLDHDSNVTPWVLAAADAGAEVTVLPVDPVDGSLDLADLQRALADLRDLVGRALRRVEPHRLRPRPTRRGGDGARGRRPPPRRRRRPDAAPARST